MKLIFIETHDDVQYLIKIFDETSHHDINLAANSSDKNMKNLFYDDVVSAMFIYEAKNISMN